MTDRELLELAAKAAGIHAHHWFEQHGVLMCSNVEGGDPDYGWNPLTDDGDSLRLAVKLNMLVDVVTDNPVSEAIAPGMPANTEHWDGDPYAATRRAIVRAAAEIGRTMP